MSNMNVIIWYTALLVALLLEKFLAFMEPTSSFQHPLQLTTGCCC